MIQRKSFLIDERVHERIKDMAKKNGLTIGGQIRRLVDQLDGKPNYASPEYKKWLLAVIFVGRLHGDDAAQEYIFNNPAPI